MASLPRHSSPITYPNKKSLKIQGLFYLIMFYVYILYSENFKRYYIGQTNDIGNRLQSHNSGYVVSTKPYLPWTLLCFLEKDTRSEAMILEKKLKNLNSEDLRKFITKYSTG